MTEMFMIVPPTNPWDKPTAETLVWLGHGTLGVTAAEAWRKQTRGQMDRVQQWFDRGYRVRRVEVTLLPEPAQ